MKKLYINGSTNKVTVEEATMINNQIPGTIKDDEGNDHEFKWVSLVENGVTFGLITDSNPTSALFKSSTNFELSLDLFFACFPSTGSDVSYPLCTDGFVKPSLCRTATGEIEAFKLKILDLTDPEGKRKYEAVYSENGKDYDIYATLGNAALGFWTISFWLQTPTTIMESTLQGLGINYPPTFSKPVLKFSTPIENEKMLISFSSPLLLSSNDLEEGMFVTVGDKGIIEKNETGILIEGNVEMDRVII
jgi:hypothetical protein